MPVSGSGSSRRKATTRRAATTPRLSWWPISIRNATGQPSATTYPYTDTSSPTLICPRAASRAPIQVTSARNSIGRPTPRAWIQLVTAPTR